MTTDVKRPTGRDQVVEALLDATARLLAVSPPDDISLRGIAREAGVNHGLVYRHFGTQDDLIDRLLERSARNWTAELKATGDYSGAIDSIFGSDQEAEASAGTWLRLLAWSLLTDPPDRSIERHRRYATLDKLPPLLSGDEDEAAFTTAAALSLVFGWRFFHPYIRSALNMDDIDFTTIQGAMREKLRQLIERAQEQPTPRPSLSRARETRSH
jgi:TetR/AcrR family transcriptional regulator, repressor for neighboring sulfatase